MRSDAACLAGAVEGVCGARDAAPRPCCAPCWSRTTTIRNRLATIMMTERAICAVVIVYFPPLLFIFLIAHNETMRVRYAYMILYHIKCTFSRGFPYFRLGICLRQAAGECFSANRPCGWCAPCAYRDRRHARRMDDQPCLPLWYLRSSDSFFSRFEHVFVQSRRRRG